MDEQKVIKGITFFVFKYFIKAVFTVAKRQCTRLVNASVEKIKAASNCLWKVVHAYSLEGYGSTCSVNVW